ncbi:MAG: DEAD/DEAH box helicase [Bdellovibrionales bacterium]|nr:DEAD/DEAH box helicase [Bdellovibrionales bacterium]
MLKPYDFQQEIIDRFKHESQAAIFGDPGTGKTLMALNILRHKYNEHKQILRTVIFCPSIVIENWKHEFSLNTKVDPIYIGCVQGTKKKRLQTLRNKNYKILIINYEAMRTLDIKLALKDFSPLVAICDESHMIKSHKSQSFKNVKEVTLSSRYKMILTGTPYSKSAEDVWSQFYFLDHGATFGSRFFPFKQRYFINLNQNWGSPNAFPNWQFNKSLLPEFKEKLSSKSVRVKKEDCLDLPDLVDVTINVEPTAEQKKHYKAIRDDLITFLESAPNDPLVIKNALTKALRLNELLSGYLRLESGEIELLKTVPKIDALMEILDSLLPNKVIIFCTFKQNYADISNCLENKKIDHVLIHGGISGEQKIKNVDTFTKNKSCNVAIVNPKSGGVGINMKEAKYAVYFNCPYSLIDFEQSRARNYRAGSIDLHDKVTHYFLTHKGMIDEKIVAQLKSKKELAESILDIKNLI